MKQKYPFNIKDRRQNEKGFTMIELIVVIAVLGILGTLVAPNVGTISAKARLATDISTVKTLKRITETYRVEQGTYPTGNSVESLSETLQDMNYLEGEVEMQTGADILISADGSIKLITSTLSKKEYGEAYEQLDPKTAQSWCDKEPIS
ncbi:MAG: prepilin-type N-terminal cleavage/methylation domain-containing protein [Cellulosilyticum sp.]|nr:prepilin-type N-terminal cleavage/methylation domain-containing protein [Cellulosilyticum sp.]